MITELVPPRAMPDPEHQLPPSDIAPPPANVDQGKPAQPETTEQHGPSMKVVLWNHTPGATEAAANAVMDCPVVAIELVAFKDEQQRQRYNEAATVFVSSTASEAQRTEAEKYLNRFDTPATLLLRALAGTDKRIVTIDVNKDTHEEVKTHFGFHLQELAIKNVHRASTRSTKRLLDASARRIGQASASRETTDIQQLQSLAAEYEGQDVPIGVLIGGAHTPVYHELAQLFPTELRYASPHYAGQQSRERFYFTPLAQMSRHHRLLPGVPLPETTTDRAVLYATRLAAARFGVAASPFDNSRQLENLTDTEVSELIIALDGIKAGILPKLQRKRTLARMDTAVEVKLIQNAARSPEAIQS